MLELALLQWKIKKLNSRNGFDYEFGERAYKEYMPTIQYYQDRRAFLKKRDVIEKEFAAKLDGLYKEYLDKINAAAEQHNISPGERMVKQLSELIYSNGRESNY